MLASVNCLPDLHVLGSHHLFSGACKYLGMASVFSQWQKKGVDYDCLSSYPAAIASLLHDDALYFSVLLRLGFFNICRVMIFEKQYSKTFLVYMAVKFIF